MSHGLSPCPEWSLHGRTSLLVIELCPYCIKPGPISRMMPPLLVIRCCPKLLLTLYNRTLFQYPMLLKVFLDIHCSGGESLTHHGLKMPYGYIKLGQHWFKIGSGNDLLQYSTKPLPDPVSPRDQWIDWILRQSQQTSVKFWSKFFATNFSEILIEILTFSIGKIHFKILSANWWSFCLSLNVLRIML